MLRSRQLRSYNKIYFTFPFNNLADALSKATNEDNRCNQQKNNNMQVL